MVIYIVDYEQSINEQITVPKHTWKANMQHQWYK